MQLYIHYIHVEIHCQEFEATSVDMLLMYIIIPILKYKTT